jgi:hypothetical protein
MGFLSEKGSQRPFLPLRIRGFVVAGPNPSILRIIATMKWRHDLGVLEHQCVTMFHEGRFPAKLFGESGWKNDSVVCSTFTQQHFSDSTLLHHQWVVGWYFENKSVPHLPGEGPYILTKLQLRFLFFRLPLLRHSFCQLVVTVGTDRPGSHSKCRSSWRTPAQSAHPDPIASSSSVWARTRTYAKQNQNARTDLR